jgi:hypothetical protein
LRAIRSHRRSRLGMPRRSDRTRAAGDGAASRAVLFPAHELGRRTERFLVRWPRPAGSTSSLISTCSLVRRATAPDSRGALLRSSRYSPSGPSVRLTCSRKSAASSTSETLSFLASRCWRRGRNRRADHRQCHHGTRTPVGRPRQCLQLPSPVDRSQKVLLDRVDSHSPILDAGRDATTGSSGSCIVLLLFINPCCTSGTSTAARCLGRNTHNLDLHRCYSRRHAEVGTGAGAGWGAVDPARRLISTLDPSICVAAMVKCRSCAAHRLLWRLVPAVELGDHRACDTS